MAREQEGGRYKSLISNTLLFGISTFGSKILVFLMTPFYTRLLTLEQSGTQGIIVSTCNLLVPLISLCVHEAVIRFGLEKGRRKRDIFTTAILVILLGFLLLLCAYPLLLRLEDLRPYMLIVYLYVLASALRSSISHFVRSGGFTRIFAIDGIFTTVLTVVFNVLFLAVFKWGVAGFVLSTVAADICSSLTMVLLLRLHRFFRPAGLRRSTAREMLAYCVPLMPTAIFWWVTNLSDRYFVRYMVDLETSGLYRWANTIPGLITMVSAIFIQAWQISAFGEHDSKDGARFFSTVFRGYYTLVFCAASALLLLLRPITGILVSEAYYESWRFVPFLILAVSFSCLVTFLGTVYNAAKKNAMVTVTTFVGAAANIGLNWLLIPLYGANGAAFATFVSFLLVFIIRAVDTRRYTPIAMQPLRIVLNLALLLLQCWVALTEPPHWALWEAAILLVIVGCNFGNLMFLLRQARRLLPKSG